MAHRIAGRHKLRVKQRRRVVEYALEQGIKPSARHFGLARRTVRTWVRRWKAGGEAGLVPQYPATRKRRLPESTRELIRIARVDHRYGAARAQVWLKRVHGLQVNAGTIQHVFREIGIPVLTKTPKRRPKQMLLFEKDEPGDSVQVDVKVVKLQREKVFQYTDRRLHALPRAPSVSSSEPAHQPALPRRGAPRLAIPDS